jgi:hypothetical protein
MLTAPHDQTTMLTYWTVASRRFFPLEAGVDEAVNAGFTLFRDASRE